MTTDDEPSGITEPGTPARRRAGALVAAAGASIALIVVVLALAVTGGNERTPAKPESVVPNGPPASTLEQSPQDDKLGSGSEQ